LRRKHALRLEGESPVEGLALAALVVHLAGDRLVQAEERQHSGRDHGGAESGSTESLRKRGGTPAEEGLHAER
jgi:hypothetical protein